MVAHNFARIHELGFDDIRVAHGAVFRYIAAGGSRITHLAARAGMTKQSMAELVGYLQSRGYVRITPDPQDGRSRLVTLTERGEAVFQALAEASYGFEAQCEGLIGVDKWRQFKTTLYDLVAALDPLREDNEPNGPKRSFQESGGLG
jgi:DNA-binding MarR family transcriptional regulator